MGRMKELAMVIEDMQDAGLAPTLSNFKGFVADDPALSALASNLTESEWDTLVSGYSALRSAQDRHVAEKLAEADAELRPVYRVVRRFGGLALVVLALGLTACAGGGSGASGGGASTSPVLVDVVNLTTSGPLSVNEGQTLSLQLVGTSSASKPLTFACTAGCSHPGFALNSSTGAIVWNTSFGQDGTYHVTFQVTDGDQTQSYSTTITVNWVDQTPMFTNLNPATVNLGQTYTLVPNATEANGRSLTYSIASPPANASFDGTTLTFTPDGSQVGTVNIDITADDGQGDTNTQTLVLTVQ